MHGSRSDPDPYTMLYQCTFTTLNQCCQLGNILGIYTL